MLLLLGWEMFCVGIKMEVGGGGGGGCGLGDWGVVLFGIDKW